MISLRFDLSSFERKAKEIGGALDQVPFALAKALNEAADRTREELISETWPRGVQVRNRTFLKAALTTKGARATKRSLRVAIYDRLGRASLTKHETGGVKPARRNLAIPTSRTVQPRRTGKGVPKNLRPAALPNAFRQGDAIYQRAPGKKHAHRKLMYVLAPRAQIKGTVPFHRDFDRIMRREMSRAFPTAMARAMATRRR